MTSTTYRRSELGNLGDGFHLSRNHSGGSNASLKSARSDKEPVSRSSSLSRDASAFLPAHLGVQSGAPSKLGGSGVSRCASGSSADSIQEFQDCETDFGTTSPERKEPLDIEPSFDSGSSQGIKLAELMEEVDARRRETDLSTSSKSSPHRNSFAASEQGSNGHGVEHSSSLNSGEAEAADLQEERVPFDYDGAHDAFPVLPWYHAQPLTETIFQDQYRIKNDSRLPEAAALGDWEAVRQMMRELGPGAINSTDSGGSTVLHWAMRSGHSYFVKELWSDPSFHQVLNINCADVNGLTPLMLAVQYERTKMLFHLLEQGADFEQQDANGCTCLALLEKWVQESASDLMLEKDVIQNAMYKVEEQVAAAHADGVVGLLTLLFTTPSVVAWRRTLQLIYEAIMAERALVEKPNTHQIYQQAFTRLLNICDLSRHQMNGPDTDQMSNVLPVMRLLVVLAESGYFKVDEDGLAVRVVELMLSCCHSSYASHVRRFGVRIIRTVTRQMVPNSRTETMLRTSHIAEPLYLIAFFADTEKIRQCASESLTRLGLDKTKPPDILNWGRDEVMMWLNLSLHFSFDALSALKEDDIDGPSLLYLNDVLVSRFATLSTKQCIQLLNAVEQLKVEHKSWTGYDVFFSYRRSYSALVRLYALQMRGMFNCFIDMEGLTAGAFNEQIFRRIEECCFFVVFFTEGSVERLHLPNDWIMREIQKALELKKVIVPIYYHMSPPKAEELPESESDQRARPPPIRTRSSRHSSAYRGSLDWGNRPLSNAATAALGGSSGEAEMNASASDLELQFRARRQSSAVTLEQIQSNLPRAASCRRSLDCRRSESLSPANAYDHKLHRRSFSGGARNLTNSTINGSFEPSFEPSLAAFREGGSRESSIDQRTSSSFDLENILASSTHKKKLSIDNFDEGESFDAVLQMDVRGKSRETDREMGTTVEAVATVVEDCNRTQSEAVMQMENADECGDLQWVALDHSSFLGRGSTSSARETASRRSLSA